MPTAPDNPAGRYRCLEGIASPARRRVAAVAGRGVDAGAGPQRTLARNRAVKAAASQTAAHAVRPQVREAGPAD